VFLLLLVPDGDHDIVEGFIHDVGLPAETYHLTEVPHADVPGYLNAADMGVLLRDDAYLNKAASPGKHGEYLTAGLPVLTTPAARDSAKLVDNGMGIVLQDIHDDEDVLEQLPAFIERGGADRQEIHEWAKPRFGTRAYIDTYVDLMESLGRGDR
jgi:hypothetical protein